ncbi:MASE4 domain-containing protein [Muricoccus radiodurans]|uniref:MASE4 domain-containing protein n=1 Tax=Muricoccus radiodurans TaxID=2231721 RepID=UPI003CF1C6BC
MNSPSADAPGPATLHTTSITPTQRRAATILLAATGVATLLLLPFADHVSPVFPGFVLINQTALVIAHALSALVLFAQFRRGGAMPLLLAAGGTLYTAAIVLLQLLSFPGVIAGGRILGAGPETTTWLWTFWHIGPPLCALAYALTLRAAPVAPDRIGMAAALGALGALALAGGAAAVATLGLPWLPHQVTGDDYAALTTSGVGPAVQLLTVVALVAVWRATRGRRTVLELWIAAGLALLILDNLLTMAGGARATIGWYAGRVEALVSAFVILWAYLHEVDALRARAEAAAEEVARAEAALRQAQRMEAVGQLTGGIAHDFNNILMVVGSGLEMIRRRPGDEARVVRSAEAGLEAVARGARLTRQLLTFARRKDLRPETVNPNALLLDFEPLLRRAVGEAARLDLDLHPGLNPASLDRSEFEAAVLNLVVNARDAVGPGGRIAVTSRNATRTAEEAGADPPGESLPAGGYAVITVADNGPGMDEATLARAFEPFFTTKEFGRGSGLGLAQVYGFARAAGGIARLRSRPGAGTTVELWLPWSASETPAAAAPARGPAAALRRATAGETVLAVEDEPAVLAAAVESLADLGYHVLPARDAAEALEHLRGEERVDVLFSDVVMPGGMNGVQLAVEARRLRPGLRVVLTSGYTNEALAGQHGVPADVPVLAKPYRREDLVRLLAPQAAMRA